MNTYRVELKDDDFEIIFASTDEKAIEKALDEYETVFNIFLLDDDYNEIKTLLWLSKIMYYEYM